MRLGGDGSFQELPLNWSPGDIQGCVRINPSNPLSPCASRRLWEERGQSNCLKTSSESLLFLCFPWTGLGELQQGENSSAFRSQSDGESYGSGSHPRADIPEPALAQLPLRADWNWSHPSGQEEQQYQVRRDFSWNCGSKCGSSSSWGIVMHVSGKDRSVS